MKRLRILPSILLVFFGVGMCFLIIESCLQMGTAVLTFMRDRDNAITNAGNQRIYKILTVGESTTANLRNGEGCWPEFLETILSDNYPDIHFEVINMGTPRIQTISILNNLEK